jgi:hypothetical protein
MVEWTQRFAAHDGLFRGFCAAPRLFGRDRNETIQLGLETIDSGEHGVHVLDWRELLAADQRRRGDRRHEKQIRTGHTFNPRDIAAWGVWVVS